jgi:NAD+ synthase
LRNPFWIDGPQHCDTQGRTLGVPECIVTKSPSGDLWVGQTDEGELGFRYADVDRLLVLMVDHRWGRQELLAQGFAAEFIDRVTTLIRRNHYKRRMPVIAKLSLRTMDRDFRYARDWGT